MQSEAQERNSLVRKQDLKKRTGLIRCPNPACSQVFYERSHVYWTDVPLKIICSKCENEVTHQSSYISLDLMETTHIYWCDSCKDEHLIKLPLDKKYCSVCKTEWYINWNYDVRAAIPPKGHSKILFL